MKEKTGEIVNLKYVGYGTVRDIKPEERYVLGWREPLQKNVSLNDLENIAWM